MLTWKCINRFGFWEIDLSQFKDQEDWLAAGFIHIETIPDSNLGIAGYQVSGPQAKESKTYQTFVRAKEVGEMLYKFSKANHLSSVPISTEEAERNGVKVIGEMPQMYTIHAPLMTLPEE